MEGPRGTTEDRSIVASDGEFLRLVPVNAHERHEQLPCDLGQFEGVSIEESLLEINDS